MRHFITKNRNVSKNISQCQTTCTKTRNLQNKYFYTALLASRLHGICLLQHFYSNQEHVLDQETLIQSLLSIQLYIIQLIMYRDRVLLVYTSIVPLTLPCSKNLKIVPFHLLTKISNFDHLPPVMSVQYSKIMHFLSVNF